MNNKIIGTALVVIGIIAIGAYAFPRIQQVANPTAGATPGLDSTSNFEIRGGVETWSYGQRLVVSTSTPCTIKTPSATSTLIFSSLALSLSTSTTLTFDIAKDTVLGGNGYATTSKISRFAYTSGTLGTMVATTTMPANGNLTTATVDDLLVFGPNQFLVWKFTNGSGVTTLNTYASTWPLGTCKAVFRVN